MAKVNRQRLTQAEYAKHRGCSAVAVHKAIKAGRITTFEDGTIDPEVADIQWAKNSRARVRTTPAPAPGLPAMPSSRAELVRIDQVRAALRGGKLAPVREALLQIPARLAPLLASQSDSGRIQTMLEAEIHQVLAPLSMASAAARNRGDGGMSARDLPDHALRAQALVDECFANYLAPPPRVSVASGRTTTGTSRRGRSAGGGATSARRTWSSPWSARRRFSLYEQIVMMFATQLGKTEVLYNAIGQRIHTEPQDMMMVQPTLQDAQDHSSKRFLPTVLATPVLRERVATRKSRDESTSWRSRSIRGDFAVYFAGANSASSLASKPLGFAVADEVDKWPADVDNEGPPLGLLEERMSNFARRKLIIASTPTIKGASEIESRYLASDRRKYFVPCPHCGEMQVLVWGEDLEYGIKWLKTAGGAARPRPRSTSAGTAAPRSRSSTRPRCSPRRWRAEAPGAGRGKVAGFWLNKLYSPLGWRSWEELVDEWVKAIEKYRVGNSAPLKKFRNSSLAETYEEKGRGADDKALPTRAKQETYTLGVVPRGGLMLTMGVDTQPDRLEARVWAFGRGEESWLVARHIIYGDPNLEEGTPGSPWTALTEIRARRCNTRVARRCRSRRRSSTPVATTRTPSTCTAARTRTRTCTRSRARASPAAVLGKPSLVDVNWRGRSLKGGVKLWSIGTDTAKDLLYGRMRLEQVGPGYVHVPRAHRHRRIRADDRREADADTVNGKRVMRWITPAGKREEAGDCMVYAYAAACYLGHPELPRASWARREQRYAPPDLFQPGPTGYVSTSRARRTRRRVNETAGREAT
jgi:phage terminase large subunit GpA-like protein